VREEVDLEATGRRLDPEEPTMPEPVATTTTVAQLVEAEPEGDAEVPHE
jgi:hypothetical protein